MSNLKYCQSHLCHTYETKDRLKGSKGNKTNQTRRRSNLYYGKGNFCSFQCYNDWADQFVDRAINNISGRITEPKKLTEKNGWVKKYRWSWQQEEDQTRHYFYNICTGEQRDITEQQFEDSNYTLNQL